jgi:hypothetical protein
MKVLLLYKELVLLPALLAFWVAGRKRPIWAQWLGLQLLAAAITEGIGYYTRDHGIHNHGLYNVYMIVEFLALWAMVGSIPLEHRTLMYVCAVGFSITLVVWIIDLIAEGDFSHISTNTLIIGGALLAGVACASVYSYMRSTFSPLHREAPFWALLSVVVYFMCFIPAFGIYNYISEHNAGVAQRVLVLNDVLFILRYVLVCISLILLTRYAGRGDT